jgi:hypothetical protein
MKATAWKLAASFIAMPASLLLSTVPGLGFVGWFFAVGLVLSIMYWFDLGALLREADADRRGLRILGVLMGVPQALFGLVCSLVGLAIVGWVLYNTFIERQSSYSGGFLTFGMGPAMVGFGALLIASAFRTGADDA